MIHGRRLAGVVLAALLAATGLAACQVSPGLAAQVGDTVITRQEVDRVVASWQRTQETPPERSDVERARQDLMTMLVVTEAGDRYAAAEGLTVPPAAVATYAEALGLPEDDPFVVTFAEFRAVMDALQATVVPVEPSPADQREIYDHLVEQGLSLPPFEEVQPFLTGEDIARAVGMRDLVATVLERADVRVQPGYELVYRQTVPFQGATSYLEVPLSEPAQVVDAA
ncbi:MAG: SurA N-terminal domain-containing protein [Micromonosporaceae bacterium]|mgnify:CR=1 FL=1|jgi:hypothetical protein